MGPEQQTAQFQCLQVNARNHGPVDFDVDERHVCPHTEKFHFGANGLQLLWCCQPEVVHAVDACTAHDLVPYFDGLETVRVPGGFATRYDPDSLLGPSACDRGDPKGGTPEGSLSRLHGIHLGNCDLPDDSPIGRRDKHAQSGDFRLESR